MSQTTVAKKFMVLGRPGMGKSYSLVNMKNQERILYINGDKKPLPFMHNMHTVSLDEPRQLMGETPDDPNSVVNLFEADDRFDTCVVDTLSFILEQFEDMYINRGSNAEKRGLWAQYGMFARDFFRKVNDSKKNWIIMNHTMTSEIEETGQAITQAFCKGSVAKIGLEAAATSVLYVKNVPLNQLVDNEFLHISNEEKEDGCKVVFQTRKDKRSRNESMKFIHGIFPRNALYIDNDCQMVFEAIDAAVRANSNK